MKNFTLRLNKTIYENLSSKSDIIGVTLSSLIKFNLFILLNENFKIINNETNETIRMTLTIPDEFFYKIEKKSIEKNTSVNNFINSVLFHSLKN